MTPRAMNPWAMNPWAMNDTADIRAAAAGRAGYNPRLFQGSPGYPS
jgi:hypothetical protein